MVFINYIVASLFLSFSAATEEPAGGWVSVEKVEKSHDQKEGEEDDPSIWVLFSKSLKEEKFLVRFPSAPLYKYIEPGSWEFSAEKEGERFELKVLPAGTLGSVDLLYSSEGRWVREHFVQTEHHSYHLKTYCKEPKSERHNEFISSFFIEKNG